MILVLYLIALNGCAKAITFNESVFSGTTTSSEKLLNKIGKLVMLYN